MKMSKFFMIDMKVYNFYFNITITKTVKMIKNRFKKFRIIIIILQ